MLEDAVIDWIRRCTIGGTVPEYFTDLLKEARARSVGFSFVIGQARTKDGQARLIQGFNGEMFGFPLTRRQALALGIQRDDVGGALAVSPHPWLAAEDPAISLDRIELDEAGPLKNDQPITGCAHYHFEPHDPARMLRDLRQYTPDQSSPNPHPEELYPERDPLPPNPFPAAVSPLNHPFPSPPGHRLHRPTPPGHYLSRPYPPGHPLYQPRPGEELGQWPDPFGHTPFEAFASGHEVQEQYALCLSYAFPNGIETRSWNYQLQLPPAGGLRFSFPPFAPKPGPAGNFRGSLVLFFRFCGMVDARSTRRRFARSNIRAVLVDLAGAPGSPAHGPRI
jgi:hypothetical protein